MNNRLPISNRAFWDVDFEKIDFEKQFDYVTIQVYNYGKWNDIMLITAYYGKDKVTKTLLNADYLTERGLHLASAILRIDKPKFRCYINKQLHPSLKIH
jgi:hypothetical protein